LQYHEAQIKFVATYILKKLPEGELRGAVTEKGDEDQ
jgi:hypothetical protein